MGKRLYLFFYHLVLNPTLPPVFFPPVTLSQLRNIQRVLEKKGGKKNANTINI